MDTALAPKTVNFSADRENTGSLAAASSAAPPFPAEAPAWDLGELVTNLRSTREVWRERRHRDPDFGRREFPAPAAVHEAIDLLCGALFPLRLGPTELTRAEEDDYVGRALARALELLRAQVHLEQVYQQRLGRAGTPAEAPLCDDIGSGADARRLMAVFARGLPGLRRLLDTDVEAAYQGDPAARSVDEVLLCYPGVRALMHHRLAHHLHNLGVPLIARLVAEKAHAETGIDIHPGARVGSHCFIDHGTGVVIGETAVLGDRVRLYQAVTLGAKRFEVGPDGALAKGRPRHPIVEDDVVIYAGATVLGRVTVGRGSTIGGNVWLTHSVPPGSQVVQARAHHDGVAPRAFSFASQRGH